MIYIKNNIKFSFNQSLSTGNQDCPNILIHGNNMEVVPELQPMFRERIKCIYIDPPYNNGEKYRYYNDNMNEEKWLNDMRDILSYLKPLLTKDGSIWISIDDKEMAYLRVEADKIFGRENFAGTIIWQQRKSRENRAVFSVNHEYILVYARNIKLFKKTRNLLPVDEAFVGDKYKNPDNDPRGPWQSVTANVQDGHAVPSQFYTIVSPSGVRHNPPKGRCWIYNEERMKQEIAVGNIWFGKDGHSVPRIKKFLKDAKLGLTPETIWNAEIVGTSDSAKKQLMKLFANKQYVFETPKPEELLKRIIEIASNEGDYVLDCYLGSGATIATAHKLNRHYIGIEMGDQMAELVVSRLNMVIQGEKTGISKLVNWRGGGNFAFYDFGNKQITYTSIINDYSPAVSKQEKFRYHQLNLWDVLEQYPDSIIKNKSLKEDLFMHYGSCKLSEEITEKNLLISLVKNDNVEDFLDMSAKVYYTGKKFPSCITLSKLYYFMPYIKHKGIRDLYLIKTARIGTRREGQIDNDPDDIRLVFEIEFIKHLFEDYKLVNLEIWHTFTDTTLASIQDKLI